MTDDPYHNTELPPQETSQGSHSLGGRELTVLLYSGQTSFNWIAGIMDTCFITAHHSAAVG